MEFPAVAAFQPADQESLPVSTLQPHDPFTGIPVGNVSSSLKKSIVFFKYGLKLNLAKGGQFDVYGVSYFLTNTTG